MHAHVTDDAVPILGKCTPPTFVRETVVRTEWRRSGPHLVIEKVGHRFKGRIAIGSHVKVATHIDVANLAKNARVHDLFLRFDQMRRASPLAADLNDTLKPPRALEHGLASAHV